MAHVKDSLVQGLVAGAVGTTALNSTTYLDMVLRGRPGSSTPEQTVERGAEVLGVEVPGDEDAREARKAGLGPLLGTSAGLAAGLVLAGLRQAGWPRGRGTSLGAAWVVAMLAGNGPMTVLGVTDPRTWAPEDWVADVVPHLAYALAATATLDAFDD